MGRLIASGVDCFSNGGAPKQLTPAFLAGDPFRTGSADTLWLGLKCAGLGTSCLEIVLEWEIAGNEWYVLSADEDQVSGGVVEFSDGEWKMPWNNSVPHSLRIRVRPGTWCRILAGKCPPPPAGTATLLAIGILTKEL